MTEQLDRRSPARRPARRVRDGARSHAAILQAAEETFAALGFQGASLAAIAEKAGVSVGLPGYFFGSKEALYQEVLATVLQRRDQALQAVAAAAEELLEPPHADPVRALECLLAGYTDFLRQHPTFVALLARDALEHAGRRESVPRHSTEFATRAMRIMARAGVREAERDPEQLLLSVIAMCYFPLEHDATIVAGMGMRAWSESFQRKRISHIVRLLRS